VSAVFNIQNVGDAFDVAALAYLAVFFVRWALGGFKAVPSAWLTVLSWSYVVWAISAFGDGQGFMGCLYLAVCMSIRSTARERVEIERKRRRHAPVRPRPIIDPWATEPPT
jgi:hypothetical protein